jgi:dynein heavy chain
MGDVEKMMFKSVRHVLYKSITHYKEVPRPDWIKVHSGQCVLNGSQVHLTAEVEDAIKNGGPKAISEYFDFLGRQLADTVQLVREKLTKL